MAAAVVAAAALEPASSKVDGCRARPRRRVSRAPALSRQREELKAVIALGRAGPPGSARLQDEPILSTCLQGMWLRPNRV